MVKRITIQTIEGHSKTQTQIINAFNTPGLSEIWVSCGSKFGKTIAAVNSFILKVPTTQNAVFRWIGPVYSQSMIGFRYAKRFLPKHPAIKFNKSDPSIIFDPLDTRWEFRTGKDPESLEGEATAGNILDEASKMTEDVYSSVRTTTTVTRGPIMGISTPRGKNWFYHKCMSAKEEMEWALRKGIPPKKIYICAPTSDNPFVHPDSIADAQRTLSRRLFKQYFLAEFVDDSNTFSDYRKCLYGERLDIGFGREYFFDPELKKTKKGKYDCKVVVGVDWAKKADYTVITGWDYTRKRMVAFWRFSSENYVDAIKKLNSFCGEFKHVEVVIHDQTGLGEVINDLLDHTELPFIGVTFTSKSKTYMVNNLIVAFEKGEPEIPYWPEMIKELDSYEVSTTEIGSMKFAASIGHDDIVSSMILGWAAVSDYSDTDLSVKIIEELKKEDANKIDWIDDYKDGDVKPWASEILGT